MSKPDKFILDATAGFRMMWFNKHEPHTIYLDQRPECEPDIVGDFRDLKQFPDKTFRLIIWDPPHVINKNGITTITHQRYFGGLEPESWQADLKQGFAELWRVLDDFGVLNLKWSTLNIPSNKLLDLFPVKPLVYQISANHERKEKGKRIRKDVTLWFCFMKIENEKKEGV